MFPADRQALQAAIVVEYDSRGQRASQATLPREPLRQLTAENKSQTKLLTTAKDVLVQIRENTSRPPLLAPKVITVSIP